MEFLYNFFARRVEYDDGMKLFGALHLTLSAFFLILYIALILYRKKLRAFGHFQAVRQGMTLVLLLNMLIHYSGRTLIGEWHFGEDLPLHICFVTNFFMMYILWTNNRHSLFSVIYFFTMVGPLPAIIFPDLSRSQSGYLFWQFIISHHVMLLFSLYCAFVLGYKTSPKHAGLAFVLGNGYVILISIFNRIAGTNYLMLGELPGQLYEVFPFLNALPAPVWLELAGIAALAAAYALWANIENRPKSSAGGIHEKIY